MKRRYLPYILFVSSICLVMASCIKTEEPNREADIDDFSLDKPIEYQSIVPTDGTSIINVQVMDTANFSKYSFLPKIKVSRGAFVFPKITDSIRFKKNKDGEYEYKCSVISEDASLKRDYLIKAMLAYGSFDQDFEKWRRMKSSISANSYFELKNPFWSSANSGADFAFQMGHPSSNPLVYPVSRSTDSYDGSFSVMLMSQHCRDKGDDPIVPVIISGSIFTGVFDMDNAVIDPLTATEFGQLYSASVNPPLSLNGYYKYQPGEPYWDGQKNKQIPNKIDSCAIYAVLFKVEKGHQGAQMYLDGHNILTSDKIVAKAIVHTAPQSSYVSFNASFIYKEQVDYTKNDYKLAIVCSSSAAGAEYSGGDGSKLFIDNLSIDTGKSLRK